MITFILSLTRCCDILTYEQQIRPLLLQWEQLSVTSQGVPLFRRFVFSGAAILSTRQTASSMSYTILFTPTMSTTWAGP